MAWYIRSNNKVSGPFPAGQIQQSILLGRIALNDQASKDKEDWLSIRTVSELIPDVLKLDRNDENRKERIEAARRWADERRYERRETSDPSRSGPGRRGEESFATSESRHAREVELKAKKLRREKYTVTAIIFIILLGAGIGVGFLLPTPQQEVAQCEAQAADKINWRDCQLIGLQSLNSSLNGAILANANLESANLVGSSMREADLSYINLRNANLSFVSLQKARLFGADLRKADLTSADIQGADLSYANLTGAKLDGVKLDGAILKNTIWTDGSTCLSVSVGACQKQ